MFGEHALQLFNYAAAFDDGFDVIDAELVSNVFVVRYVEYEKVGLFAGLDASCVM